MSQRIWSACILLMAVAAGVTSAFAQPVPTGEDTAAAGFDVGLTCGAGANCITLGKWAQTLLPIDTNFDGRVVNEQNPVAGGGGSGNDTCHFAGSAYAAFDRITGGAWTVGTLPGGISSPNMFGYDYVGWLLNGVTYYRNRGRAPCGTTFEQRMVINMNGGGTQAYGGNNTGDTNTLGGNINVRTVTSTRSGLLQTLVR